MFSGSIVALVTPFTADNTVDFAALERLVEWHIASGTKGLVPCGTTGESATFTHTEQAEVISQVVKMVQGRIPVIGGAGSNNTIEAVALAKAAEAAGADGILSVTPYYNKPNQEGLFQHYAQVRGATDLPIVLYNVPGRTGCKMSAETASRVAELGNIDSVKDATGDLTHCQALLDLGVRVLSGDDFLTFPMMCLGASGVISVVANFAPKLMADLCDAVSAGDIATARQLHRQVVPLEKVAFSDTNPIPAKTAVAALGFCEDRFRLPLVPMSESDRACVQAALAEADLLSAASH